MFVKVLRYYDDPESKEAAAVGSVSYGNEVASEDRPVTYTETVYECSSVGIRPIGSKKLLVDLEGIPNKPGYTLTLEIEKAHDNGVFLMNENGRTIDHYQWSS